MNITIIGAGSWGIALATVLAHNGHNVLLYAKTLEVVKEINDQRTCHKYANGVCLDLKIGATNSISDAFNHAEYIVLAIPAKAIMEFLAQSEQYLDLKVFIIASKGLINQHTISKAIEEKYLDKIKGIVCLSGPSFSKWVLLKKITVVVSASKSLALAKNVQKMFSNNYFRVYSSKDIEGVQYCGALKNVIALGSGILEGRGYGANAKAALISRGLHEMMNFCDSININKGTLFGLCGVGDLVLTTTDLTSRNYHLGYLLGQNKSLQEAQREIGLTVEGLTTLKEVYDMAQRLQIEMPIVNTLYRIIYLKHSIEDEIGLLMNRQMKDEY